MMDWQLPSRGHWFKIEHQTEMPRCWQDAADTRQEREAMEADLIRSQDEINDRKEDTRND